MTAASAQHGPLRAFLEKVRYGLCIQTILQRLWHWGIVVMPCYWVRERYDAAALKALEASFAEYAFEPVGRGDMKFLGATKGQSPYRGEAGFARLLEDGHKCYALKHEGSIAAFTWVSYGGCTMETYRPPMNQDEVYLFDMYTLPEFRGKGLAPYLRLKVQQAVLADGDFKFYSITDVFNRSAIKFKRKINATFVRKIWYFRLWSLFDFWRETDLSLGGGEERENSGRVAEN